MLTRAALVRRLRHVPVALAASLVLLVFSAVVALVLDGMVAASGAIAGVALVSGSYALSHLCIAAADAINPSLVMPIGLAVYAAKLLVVGLVLATLAGIGWPGITAMVLAVAAAVVVWTVTQAVWVWRAKLPYVEIETR